MKDTEIAGGKARVIHFSTDYDLIKQCKAVMELVNKGYTHCALAGAYKSDGDYSYVLSTVELSEEEVMEVYKNPKWDLD